MSPVSSYRRPVSSAGHSLARGFETLVLYTYDDHLGKKRVKAGHKFKGVPTIGWGNTRHAMPIREIDRETAERFYQEDAADAVSAIYAYLPSDTIENLPQQCYDALFSFVFNTGPQVFWDVKHRRKTQFYETIMTDLQAVPAQMRRWVYDNGKKLNGLFKRREAEASLWLSGLDQALIVLDIPPAERVPISESYEARIVPEPPKAAISQGTMLDRPTVGMATSGLSGTGAAMTETAQSMNVMGEGLGMTLKIMCLALFFVGLGLTIWAVVKQQKAGRA